jgi:hypothetical protein
MLIDELQKKYDHLFSRVGVMMIAQTDYFQSAVKGFKDQTKLQKAKALEAEVKKLLKAELDAKAKQQQSFF